MNRRDFLLSLAGAACLPGCAGETAPLPPGALLGPSLEHGHRLRARDFPPPEETRRVGIAIIGGGIGGLSAAWKLERAGFDDFRLFELEDEVGGNARSGQNAVSAYPWGAHYLPLPGPEARAVRELLADLGVLLGDPLAEAPRYDERHLCFAPQERLYRHGAWQEGLLPQIGTSPKDHAQYRRFFDLVAKLKQKRGRDSRRAFALPMALASTDTSFLAYDRLSMKGFLLQQGLDSAPLHWYVNYACRDDYGSDYSVVSAWAGLHYFAGRDGHAQEAESDQVLTWPEGNGWLVKRLRERLTGHIDTGMLAHRIEETRDGITIDVLNLRDQRCVRWQAKEAIFAAPSFLLPHVLANPAADLAAAARELRHAPWLVANLTLRGLPAERTGAAPAWDNVLYESPALGYVVATHQSLRSHPGPTMLTYYWALSEYAPEQARAHLFKSSRDEWARRILADLSRPHPDLHQLVERIDVFRWAHAMAQPRPGFLASRARLRIARPLPRLHFAHADASGFSIFEEANYRGVSAAESALRRMGIRVASSLV